MKPNYAGTKRKKELERLKRQEEKAQKKKERKEQKAREEGGGEPVMPGV